MSISERQVRILLQRLRGLLVVLREAALAQIDALEEQAQVLAEADLQRSRLALEPQLNHGAYPSYHLRLNRKGLHDQGEGELYWSNQTADARQIIDYREGSPRVVVRLVLNRKLHHIDTFLIRRAIVYDKAGIRHIVSPQYGGVAGAGPQITEQ